MRNFDQVSPALQSSLTHYQIARLQGQALKICSEQLTGTILNEWLSNHPEMLQRHHDSKEIIRRALDESVGFA
jgi:hypothetical protein